MSAERKTLKEYLEWASLKPRTSEWSALVTYDRDKCNQLLMQEYIEKHDSSQIMPPINEAYGTSESTWSWKLDYVTDAPRLSFENDPDTDTAELNMRMAIVGGKSLSLYDIAGYPQIIRVSSYDPLDYPQLIANRTALKDVQGNVNDAGEVQLDLGDPIAQRYIWEETLDRIKHQRQMAGSFFKRKYREAEPVKRRFSLGKLAHTEQEFMKPESFKLRTIMEGGANLLGAANYGNGVVEVRIAMDGSDQGGAPGEDWLYPLPSDRPELNSSMILSTDLFMLNVIGKGTAKAFNAPDATFKVTRNGQGFIKILEVEEHRTGYLAFDEFKVNVGGVEAVFSNYRLPIWLNEHDKLTMTLSTLADGSSYLGTGMGNENVLQGVDCTYDGKAVPLSIGLGMTASYQFFIDETERRLKVKLASRNAMVHTVGTAPEAFRLYLESNQFTNDFSGKVADVALKVFNEKLEAIDVFVLNTLLFNSEDAVQFKSANLTGELAMFGSISPRLTTFSISPLEVMVGYDQTHPFKIDPPVTGVTEWKVEGLDGSSQGVGSIDGNGLFKAPALSDIPGTYKRVKVSATNNGHTSKALVTVIARTITLNPLIEVCNASLPEQPPETREFSAHTMNGTLKWSVIGEGTIPPTAGPEGKNTYNAPLKQKTYFTYDEILVENTSTGQQQKSLVVVKHEAAGLSIRESFEGMPAGQVKFQLTIGIEEPDPNIVTWECVPADAGTVDVPTAVFTANPASASQFVLIKGTASIFGMRFEGFIILPLPLAPLPLKPPPEIPQEPNLEKITELLQDVRKEFESFTSIAGVSDQLEGNLQRITELAGGINNGQ